jgi:hypothetical protein
MSFVDPDHDPAAGSPARSGGSTGAPRPSIIMVV